MTTSILLVLQRSIRTEKILQERASLKIKAGEKSAYHDLCMHKNQREEAWDVACIWFSLGILTFGIVALLFPILLRGVLFLQRS